MPNFRNGAIVFSQPKHSSTRFLRIPSSYRVVLWKHESFAVLGESVKGWTIMDSQLKGS